MFATFLHKNHDNELICRSRRTEEYALSIVTYWYSKKFLVNLFAGKYYTHWLVDHVRPHY